VITQQRKSRSLFDQNIVHHSSARFWALVQQRARSASHLEFRSAPFRPYQTVLSHETSLSCWTVQSSAGDDPKPGMVGRRTAAPAVATLGVGGGWSILYSQLFPEESTVVTNTTGLSVAEARPLRRGGGNLLDTVLSQVHRLGVAPSCPPTPCDIQYNQFLQYPCMPFSQVQSAPDHVSDVVPVDVNFVLRRAPQRSSARRNQ
jgi:hypothetical protein